MNDSLRTGVVPFAARVLLVAEFAIAANGKIRGWDGQAGYMAQHGMRFVGPLLAAALVIEVVGPLCLVSGVWARQAAAVLFVYLGIVSLSLHDFWRMSGTASGANQTQFFKNLGMMGGLLMVAAYGPGRWALRPGRTGASPNAARGRRDARPARPG